MQTTEEEKNTSRTQNNVIAICIRCRKQNSTTVYNFNIESF